MPFSKLYNSRTEFLADYSNLSQLDTWVAYDKANVYFKNTFNTQKYNLYDVLYASSDGILNITGDGIPIAVCAIPSSHMPDGKARFIALKDCTNSAGEQQTWIYGGYTCQLNNKDSEFHNLGSGWGYPCIGKPSTDDDRSQQTIFGSYQQLHCMSQGRGFPAFEFDDNSVSIVYNGNTGYKVADLFDEKTKHYVRYDLRDNSTSSHGWGGTFASPFLTDNSKNTVFFIQNFNNSNNEAILFNGKSLTQKLVNISLETLEANDNATIYNGATDTIQNLLGYNASNLVYNSASINKRIDGCHFYPAALACYAYSTPGTSAGNWYLGSGGEMMYVFARCKSLNTVISSLGGTPVRSGTFCWSSTQYSANYSSCFLTNYGFLYDYYKYYSFWCRPFLSL